MALEEVFGKPKNKPEPHKEEENDKYESMRTPMRTDANLYANADIIAILKDQLTKAEARAEKAEAEREHLTREYIKANEAIRLLSSPNEPQKRHWWQVFG